MENAATGKQSSLHTRDRREALENPSINVQIARAYAAIPKRYAMAALGHNSKAVHRAYAKRAAVEVPSLEEYEQRATSRAA